MPTAYTNEIEKGISFTDFALTCARAFGATITLKETPLSPEIPEFEPSTYYKEELEKAEIRLCELKKMKPAQANKEADNEYNEKVEARDKYVAEMQQLKLKYQAMLKEVVEWEPPTKNHEGLKAFMLEQIHSSIERDCDIEYYTSQKIEQFSGEDWLVGQIQKVSGNITYYKQEWKKEQGRVKDRNLWVKHLKESLVED